MGAAQGKKVPRRCCAETLRRARALFFGQISPSQRTHASGPATDREPGDSGDPAGTGWKIDVPWQRELQPSKPDDFFISPTSIAAEVFHLAHQPKDAWSFLAEVRPFHEPW